MKKKVLFFQDSLSCGGTEMALFDLISLLDKEKYDVSVFIYREGGEFENKFRQAGIHVLTSWSNVNPSRNLVGRIKFRITQKMIQKARKERKQPWKFALQNEKFDLCVSYLTEAKWIASPISVHGSPTIYYVHGNCVADDWMRDNVLSGLEQIKKAKKVICVSEKAKEAFTELTGLSRQVYCLHNPIDANRIYGLSKESQELPDNYICAVGRLCWEKGFLRLLQIWSQIQTNGSKLVIVGDGAEREKMQELIKELSLENSVCMMGMQENPYPYIANARFLVCSSYAEGLPVVTMEALALGVPVVSAYPSVGELFGQEACGLITENDDESLKIGIEKMLNDQEFYAEAKQAAGRRAEFYASRALVEKVEAIYDQVIAGER